jgi:hypothetical protein
VFAWDAARTHLPSSIPDTRLVEALTLYDDSVASKAPDWPPSEALQASGDVVFRSDWSRDATYLLVRGEHGLARTAGGNYEQADSTSFLFTRGSVPLVIEAGFGGWDVRAEGCAPSAHNLILLDGKGPPVKTALGAVVQVDVDVQTLDQVFDPQASAVRVRRVHDRTIFDRTVVFAGEAGAFVFDQVRCPDDEHTFTWQVHLNGGGTTGGRLLVDDRSAVLKHPQAALRLALVCSDAKAEPIRVSSSRHYWHEGEPQTHSMLRCSTVGRQANFLTVLACANDVAALPSVSGARSDQQLVADVGGSAHAAFRLVRAEAIGNGKVRCDGLALLWIQTKSGAVDMVLVVGATHLWVEDKLVWSDRIPQTLVWRADRITSGSHLGESG